MISILKNWVRLPLLMLGCLVLIGLLGSCKTVPGCQSAFCNYKEDLTLYGRNVRLLYEDGFKAGSAGCQFRAELNTGAYVPGTNQEAITILRNMAGEIGANTVVMQSYNRDRDAIGRAYVCDASGTQISTQIPATNTVPVTNTVSNTINTATSTQNTQTQTTNPNSNNPSSFQAAAGSTVTDTGKRLSWQTCSMGQSYQNGKCAGQATAESLQTAASYCNQMSTAGYTYRLPDRTELVSVLKEGNSTVKVDPRVFPDTKADIYWTRESYNGSPITNWVVDFGGGGSFGYGTENQAYVRCVANLP